MSLNWSLTPTFLYLVNNLRLLMVFFGFSITLINFLEFNRLYFNEEVTAQKIKFSIKDFFSKCEQIRSFLRIWSHLLKKSVMENFIFCAVSTLDANFKTNLKR